MTTSNVGRILRSALVGMANLVAVKAVVSSQDLADYPYFAQLMQEAGEGLDWQSHKATSTDGYITTLWRITGANGERRDAPLGPVLLTHGMYSDGSGWMERTDGALSAFPVQLHNMGYDVWISNARGTESSLGHTLLDWTTQPEYFDYCFEEMANDVSAQVDTILAAREGETCAQVQVVTHSTGSSPALLAAIKDLTMQEKMARLVTFAPCYFVNMDVIEVNLREPQSAQYFFTLLRDTGITTMFGPKFSLEV